MYRRIRVAIGARGRKPDALVVALFEVTPREARKYARLDERVGGALSRALKRPEFSAAGGALTVAHPDRGVGRLFVVGLGDPQKFSGRVLRVAAANVLRASAAASVRRLEWRVVEGLKGKIPLDEAARAVGDGLALAGFQFDSFKGKVGAATTASHVNAVVSQLDVDIDAVLRLGVQRSLKIGESVSFARELAATPPNVADPAHIAATCRAMARRTGLRCTVISQTRARQLHLGGLLAVGAAGSKPPVLICLEHRPRGTARDRPVLLVGKAVTFDTGGYCIKPATSMDGMKYDKCGGMAVIGAMHAVARLNVGARVVGLIPTAENMVSRRAYRPGDILTLANGVTVEVTNTDAEGRLILADALAYGCKAYRPRAVIDLATLTGGVVVALGRYSAGLFCADHPLRSRLLDAGEFTGERLWHLPLWDEHREQMRGTHGDLVNSAGREASPIQGAAFLSHFVGEDAPARMPDIPWAHIDIAGVSDVKHSASATGLYGKGPTGFGVRLLVRLLETMAGTGKVASRGRKVARRK